VAARPLWLPGLLALAACDGGTAHLPADAQPDVVAVTDAAVDASRPDAAPAEDAAALEAAPPERVLGTMMLRSGGERTLQHMECAGNAAGDGMVIWRETDDFQHEVWTARLGRDGQWQPPLSLGLRPTTELDRLGVTLDADGNALAVWNELDGPQHGVVSARAPAGAAWTAPAAISPGWVLTLVGSPSGAAVAHGVVEGTAPTLLRYLPETGWREETIHPERPGFFFAGAGGRGVMFWNESAGAGHGHYLEASEYGGSTWGPPVRVQDAMAFSHPIPSVNAAFASGGNGLVVWNRGGDLQGQLWVAFTASPTAWEPPHLLGDGDAPLWTTTALVQPGGEAMVSWETGMPPRRKVWTALRRAGAWQDSVLMGEGAEADTAALSPSGDALVAWSTAGRVYGRHNSLARGWGPAQLALGDNGGVSDLCAFIDGKGHGWILWINGGPQRLRAAPISD
jgi:hypothetical protein